MNIKEHIEAGHYQELGEHNAEIVPTTDKRTVRIADVDTISGRICGWLDGWHFACTWNADGKLLSNGASNDAVSPDLLPPPPRKVKVKPVWALLSHDGTDIQGWTNSEEQAADWRRTERCPVALMSGEYEEPWS